MVVTIPVTILAFVILEVVLFSVAIVPTPVALMFGTVS